MSPPVSHWPFAFGLFLFTALFTRSSGLIVFMADSFLYADRAKHFLLARDIQLTDWNIGLAYPPLYPLTVCLAYFAPEPAAAHVWILLIHSLFVAAQLWPYHRLLTGYGRVPERPALWLAAALSLAPFTLPYASLMMSEVLYLPLFLWLLCFYLRAQETGAWRYFLLTGLTGAALLLTRSAGQSILVSLLAAFGISWWQYRREKSWLGYGIFALAFLLPISLWKGIEAEATTYNKIGMEFLWERPLAILANPARLMLHASWFFNTLVYPFAAPLCIAGFFFLVLLFVRPRLMWRDPLAPFTILVLAISSLVPSMIFLDHWGGTDLTWNRYLAPHAVLPLLIAIRHRRFFTQRMFLLSMAIPAALFFIGRPAELHCHFVDSLLLFAARGNPLELPGYAANILYGVVLAVPAWLWLRRSPVSRSAAVVCVASIWLAALLAASSYYRGMSVHNVTYTPTLAREAAKLAAANPSIPAFQDPQIDTAGYFSSYLIRFWWPGFIYTKPPSELSAKTPTFYVTDKRLPNREPILDDGGPVRIYRVGPGLTSKLGENIAGLETTNWNGKPLQVRWLRAATDFTVDNTGDAMEALVTIPLGVLSNPHNVQLEWNGKRLPETHRVSQVVWLHGPQNVTFRVPCAVGRNTARIVTEDPLETLPGGRQVALLLAGEIAVTQGK